MGHKRIDETMIYVHVAENHRREIPDPVLEAATTEGDPDRRVPKMLAARGSHVAAATDPKTKKAAEATLQVVETRGSNSPGSPVMTSVCCAFDNLAPGGSAPIRRLFFLGSGQSLGRAKKGSRSFGDPSSDCFGFVAPALLSFGIEALAPRAGAKGLRQSRWVPAPKVFAKGFRPRLLPSVKNTAHLESTSRTCRTAERRCTRARKI